MKKIITDFVKIYEELSSDNITTDINKFHEIYAEDIKFTDPIHTTNNLNEFKEYFLNTATNLDYLKFNFIKQAVAENTAFFEWTLHFSNKNINQGEKITTEGCSAVMIDPNIKKITLHRDYYDLNQMLYSHITILKNVTSFINNKVAFK